MNALARIPTPAEARRDPAHAPWFAMLDAIEAVRRWPSQSRLDAVGTAFGDLLQAMDAEKEAKG